MGGLKRGRVGRHVLVQQQRPDLMAPNAPPQHAQHALAARTRIIHQRNPRQGIEVLVQWLDSVPRPPAPCLNVLLRHTAGQTAAACGALHSAQQEDHSYPPVAVGQQHARHIVHCCGGIAAATMQPEQKLCPLLTSGSTSQPDLPGRRAHSGHEPSPRQTAAWAAPKGSLPHQLLHLSPPQQPPPPPQPSFASSCPLPRLPLPPQHHRRRRRLKRPGAG